MVKDLGGNMHVMKQQSARRLAVIALTVVLTLGGCAKKKTIAPPPPPPPAPAPTAKLTANPTTVNAGQGVQLAWTTSNADTVSIEGIGQVSSNGSQTVRPTDSTTYHLIAKGDGGTADDTVRVTVNAAPPPISQAAPPSGPSLSDEQLLQQRVPDIFFDYDSYSLRPEDNSKLQAAAQFLNSQKPNWKVVIEGNCDERGSTEYNLALGDNRANAAKQALVAAGVNASRIQTISFGKEKPACNESTEECWQQNRRDHFRLGQ
jgi:peptidoglycan-associated lipoprotein